MTFCHKCGKRIEKGHRVCSTCGSYLRKRGHDTNYLTIIIRAVLVIALIWVLIWFFKKYWNT